MASKKKKRRKKAKLNIDNADPHDLYQRSVQAGDREVEILQQIYREVRGRKARHLREDFCGTALVSAWWARQGKRYTAEGYDIDPEPIGWGTKKNLKPLRTAASRVKLFTEDVREPSRKRPDVRCAENFSYRVFKKRKELLGYFRKVRHDLADDGIFVLDIHGGSETFVMQEEPRVIEGKFTYVWEQAEYVPVTGDYLCYIHFDFEDGTRLDRAFTYDWRLWELPELTDVLHDAGFREVRSWWEGTDDDGESGDGVFTEDPYGDNCQSWITYLVAVP